MRPLPLVALVLCICCVLAAAPSQPATPKPELPDLPDLSGYWVANGKTKGKEAEYELIVVLYRYAPGLYRVTYMDQVDVSVRGTARQSPSSLTMAWVDFGGGVGLGQYQVGGTAEKPSLEGEWHSSSVDPSGQIGRLAGEEKLERIVKRKEGK